LQGLSAVSDKDLARFSKEASTAPYAVLLAPLPIPTGFPKTCRDFSNPSLRGAASVAYANSQDESIEFAPLSVKLQRLLKA